MTTRIPSAEEGEVVEFIRRIPGIELGIYEVTKTQRVKSLVDANYSIRTALFRQGVHDYDSQGRGQDYKVQHDIKIIGNGESRSSSIVLYRPNTKRGDPRFWIYNFRKVFPLVRAGDLIGIVVARRGILAVNLSALDLTKSIRSKLADEVADLRDE